VKFGGNRRNFFEKYNNKNIGKNNSLQFTMVMVKPNKETILSRRKKIVFQTFLKLYIVLIRYYGVERCHVQSGRVWDWFRGQCDSSLSTRQSC